VTFLELQPLSLAQRQADFPALRRIPSLRRVATRASRHPSGTGRPAPGVRFGERRSTKRHRFAARVGREYRNSFLTKSWTARGKCPEDCCTSVELRAGRWAAGPLRTITRSKVPGNSGFPRPGRTMVHRKLAGGAPSAVPRPAESAGMTAHNRLSGPQAVARARPRRNHRPNSTHCKAAWSDLFISRQGRGMANQPVSG